jgi:hypothetical protein
VSAENDPTSPWAGESIPVSDPPEIRWDHLPPVESAEPFTGHASTPTPPFPPPILIQGAVAPTAPVLSQPSAPTRRSRALVLIGVATAMTLLVGGSIWLTNKDKQPDESQNDDSQNDEARIDPVTRPAVEPEPAVATATTTPRNTLPPITEDPNEILPEEPPTVDVAPDRIELPPEVAAIQVPTEVVIQTEDRRLYTLSLPGGDLRSVDLTEFGDGLDDGDYYEETISVSPSGTIVSLDNRLFVAPRIGEVIEVDVANVVDFAATLHPFGWIEQDDGSSAFVVVAISEGDSSEAWFAISDDGSARLIRGQSLYSTPFAPNGQYMINDGGGTYRVGSDGTATRISSGYTIAVTPLQLLIRECDEALTCAVVRESKIDGTRTTISDVATGVLDGAYAVALSPDGSTVTLSGFSFDSRQLLDLATGDVRPVPSTYFSGATLPTWAADSSGEFMVNPDAGDGLSFLDRASGTVIDFGEELGIVTAIGVRYPEALFDT